MSNFYSLEEEFKSLCDGMRRTIDGRLSTSYGEEQKKLVRELERANENAEAVLGSMDSEVYKAPAYGRSELRNRLIDNRKYLEVIMKKMRQMTRLTADMDDMEAMQKAKMIQGTRALERASQSVQRSRQIAEETTEIGINITGELDRQGETLERTRDKLLETQSALDKSRVIIRGMAVRVVTSKIIMSVIIGCEAAILAGVIYLKFVAKTF